MKLSQLIEDLQSVGRVVGFDAPVAPSIGTEVRATGQAGECHLHIEGAVIDSEEECPDCHRFASKLADAERSIERFQNHAGMLRKAINRKASLEDVNDICGLMEEV